MVACLILVPGAYSIEVGFSAENGGESVSLSSSYDVGTDVSVNEESTASFDKPAIENTRSVSGTGDINANQAYSGSGGYTGSATLSSQGVCGSLQGSASLTPGHLSANQDVSLSGSFVDTGMGLAYEGDSADLGIAISSGSINSGQSIETGSVNNQILANIEAQIILYRQLINILSTEVNSVTTIQTPTRSPVVLNAAANSYTGNSLAYKGTGGQYNVDDDYIIKGPAGSEVEIITRITNAVDCDYHYYPNSIYSQEKRTTLTVKDADTIWTCAGAGNTNQQIGSSVSASVNHGSLYGYSNKAFYDGTNFVASHSADSALGISPYPYYSAVSFLQSAHNAEVGSNVNSGLWTDSSSNGAVDGFSGSAIATDSKTETSQTFTKASGEIVSAYSDSQGIMDTSLSTGNTYVTNGEISGYKSSAIANKGSSSSSQNFMSAQGDSISIHPSASHLGYDTLDDYASSGTVIEEGSIRGYSSDASAQVKFGGAIATSSSQGFSYAKGDLVRSYTTATPSDFYAPSAKDTITYIDVTNGDLGTYHDKSSVDNGAAELSQTFGTANGDIEAWRYRYPYSGKEVTAKVDNGFIIGYSNDAYVDDDRVSFSQGLNYAKGDSVRLNQQISNPEGDQVQGTIWTDGGSIGSYYSKVDAINSEVDLAQHISTATGNQVFAGSTASHAYNNIGGERASVFTTVTSGSLSPYSDSSNVGTGKSEVSADIHANGDSIDVQSHAENERTAYEGYSYEDSSGEKQWFPYDVNYGSADFQFVKSGILTANINTEADSNNVDITATNLPENTKTAIILEPFASCAVNIANGNDSKLTIFPALVRTGYATTRYTDSAASADKFTNLDKYNVAIILSHMNNDEIGLSTSERSISSNGDLVKANQLNYNNPPSQSLVILGGCSSFGNFWWDDSDLENAVEKANLRVGRESSARMDWNQDSIGQLIIDMSNGSTFSEANSSVWNDYRFDWCNLHGLIASDPKNKIVDLTAYGNSDFKL